jgi:nucleoside-diphosphate-sugar epimerase
MDAANSKMRATTAATRCVSRAGIDYAELALLIRAQELRFRTLSGASILLTGATGWFGTWLLDTLCAADDMLELGLSVTAVSRNPRRFAAKFPELAADRRIRWVESDVRNLAVDPGRYSHVIHAASETSLDRDQDASAQMFDTIVEGTRRTLAAASNGCRSFLLVSSGAVYGPAPHGVDRFVEDAPGSSPATTPKDAYARGKQAAERMVATAAEAGVPARIARCFAFVGPFMPFDKHFAIGNFIADAVDGREIRVRSDGRPLRSYLYMTDLVSALIAILADGADVRPYNVGSPSSISVEQLARCVDRVVGGRGVIIEGSPSDPSDRYVPDTTRLQAELNCIPAISLDAAIARTAAWYRAQTNRSMQ